MLSRWRPVVVAVKGRAASFLSMSSDLWPPLLVAGRRRCSQFPYVSNNTPMPPANVMCPLPPLPPPALLLLLLPGRWLLAILCRSRASLASRPRISCSEMTAAVAAAAADSSGGDVLRVGSEEEKVTGGPRRSSLPPAILADTPGSSDEGNDVPAPSAAATGSPPTGPSPIADNLRRGQGYPPAPMSCNPASATEAGPG